MRKRGFSLVEILMAMIFLGSAILGLVMVNSSSNRGAMDAYYEFMAYSLAQEAVEIYRGLGFAYAEDVYHGRISSTDACKVGDTTIRECPFPDVAHPVETGMFQRSVALDPVEVDGIRAYRITVRIFPRNRSKVDTWLSRDAVVLESLIVEQPQ